MLLAASFLCGQEYAVEKLTGGLRHVSALAWSRDGYLLIADLPASRITKIDSKGTSTLLEKTPAAGLAFDKSNRLIVSDPKQHRVARVDRKGAQEAIATAFGDKPFNGPGAVAASPDGGIWIADPSYGEADRQKQIPFYGIYHLSGKGELRAAAKLAGRPGGLAVSADGRTLYVSDADNRKLLTFAVEKDGTAGSPRQLADLKHGVPSAVAIGPGGHVYVAVQSGVEEFSAEGAALRYIQLPERPSSLAFDTGTPPVLYAGAQTSVYRVSFQAAPKLEKSN